LKRKRKKFQQANQKKKKMLKSKNVILGVTASIAAYKSAFIVRELKKAGALVKVIQTDASLDFVTPLTLSTLSENTVLTKMVEDDTKDWISHVDLAQWADLILIAPVTAKTMAKMVSGECDSLLLATYLSAKCPVYFAPAMDLDMYKHPSTKQNIEKLVSFGNKFIAPTFGEGFAARALIPLVLRNPVIKRTTTMTIAIR
jgi:phosphopantothenoylcysteine decarboxylase/phosphopantothenate--cysteine ligase